MLTKAAATDTAGISSSSKVAFDEASCETREHSVTLDLRSTFADQFIITCAREDDTTVLDRMEKALNIAFPYISNGWDGTVSFASFQFDFAQDVSNVAGLGRERHRRELQEVCPARSEECPLFFDACRFSCGTVTSTSCNGMELSSIEELDKFLSAAATKALRSLDLECLGFESDLMALVRVDSR